MLHVGNRKKVMSVMPAGFITSVMYLPLTIGMNSLRSGRPGITQPKRGMLISMAGYGRILFEGR